MSQKEEYDLSYALPRYLIEMDIISHYKDLFQPGNNKWHPVSKMIEFDDNKLFDEVKAFKKKYPRPAFDIRNVRVSKVVFKFHVK